MRYAASFTVHTPSTPSTRINITPVARREEAIQRGLKRRLEQLSEERERRARAAAAADEDFSAEFLTMARQVFDMIDVDESGYLDKDEIIDAGLLAVAMGGSPRMMYMRHIYEEVDKLFD